jgi:hypothetical protein
MSIQFRRRWLSVAAALAVLSSACSSKSSSEGVAVSAKAESCMTCHNGSSHDDYAGPGLENPHPFPGAATLTCTECHGGDGSGGTELASHVPPPPEIGDDEQMRTDPRAYFNRLTLAGIDKFPDYVVNGRMYSAIDFLQFINPGDLRVVTKGRSCGKCHGLHSESVARSPLATEMGILSSSLFTLGIDVTVNESSGLYGNTASDRSFRAVDDLAFPGGNGIVGAVARLEEFPVFSTFGNTGALDIFRNQAYNVFDLPAGQRADNSVLPNSHLANLFHEQVAFTCGDCHLGSAGANNRYGDFRSSGCTACHMSYSQDGRSGTDDPRIDKLEPANPDQIRAPERSHIKRHMIASVAKTLPSGEFVQGIDDHTCAGCHQGSNRTVMQYWGIRLDQNADLRNREQYPANPVTFQNTARDTRLFDPAVGNRTFNGRNANQYILFEDYDGDSRDDTPEDVHYEAGLGCIDCHGTHDIHGGTVGDPADARIVSRQEQAVAIRCESCHGTIDAYAATKTGTTYDGTIRELAVDAEGNVLRNVERDPDGGFYLTSRLTGRRHFIKQTRDTIVDSGRRHPTTNDPVYSTLASFAMGRADGTLENGIGPIQSGSPSSGFSHTDNMSCVSCHASWTNSCIGCHLGGEYDTNPNNISNITGERIVYKQANADFVYQTPVPFQLGIDTHNKLNVISPNTLTYFQYQDLNGDRSKIFAFSDRNGNGNNPGADGRNAHPALSHNVMMPHSIRGKVSSSKEGPRYCVACHLTDNSVANFGGAYDTFRQALETNDYAALDFDVLRQHIGQNPGNQLDSPFWVHMVAGLGSGLFLFDENGCPINPLDENANRVGCDDVAPAAKFDLARVRFNLDRIVQATGVSNASNNHMLLEPGVGPNLRDGSLDPQFAGPLGATLIRRLTDPDTGIVLDSWVDADGNLQGDAATILANP